MCKIILVSFLFLSVMCFPVAGQASRLGQPGKAMAVAKEPSAASAMGRMISRKQALRDIDSLILTLSEVHPNMFFQATQASLFDSVAVVRGQIADSVSVLELYRLMAPIVAMIGDGHTSLAFPAKELPGADSLFMPMLVSVRADSTIVARRAAGDAVPPGAEVLQIGGVAVSDMVASMMRYASGERSFYRIDDVDRRFSSLLALLYPQAEYEVAYRAAGSAEVRRATLKAAPQAELWRLEEPKDRSERMADYSFSIDKERGVAVMHFHSLSAPERMGVFADSMFAALRAYGIGNLVIDVRDNGGGNSAVGDTLLRYIAPKPFKQFGKCLVRVTPTTKRLGNRGVPRPGWYYYAEAATGPMVTPRTIAEGHYGGNVYLLTSHRTFSSASSFSWAFKHFGMGTVVGEETGGMNVCYGDVLRYRLPYSGLSCYVSWKRFWQYGADESSIHGTLPDVAVPQGQAMDAALSIIAAGAKAAK